MDTDLRGFFPAFVCDVKDDEKRGRIKVLCSNVFGDTTTESAWCEPCGAVAIDGAGDICVPPIGEGVWITFVEGDIDQPVWMHGWLMEGQTPFGNKEKEYRAAVKGTRVISYEDNRITMVNGTMTIDLKGMPSAIVISGGNVTFNCNVIVNGNFSINGNSTINGAETVTLDSTIGGKSFLGHRHTGNLGNPTSAPI